MYHKHVKVTMCYGQTPLILNIFELLRLQHLHKGFIIQCSRLHLFVRSQLRNFNSAYQIAQLQVYTLQHRKTSFSKNVPNRRKNCGRWPIELQLARGQDTISNGVAITSFKD